MERNKKVEPPPVALTIADAARRLSVSTTTIRRMLARGVLPRVLLGRAVRVPTRSVDELAESGGVARAK
ncbi:MAG: helix-turn-helix domain-containing protein [Phycisphaerales bacterium]